MAAIHDLIKQIEDDVLRERIAAETKRLLSRKRFGLVFEEHLPEMAVMYGAKLRPGSIVVRRGDSLDSKWRVLSVDNEQAVCVDLNSSVRKQEVFRIADLAVIRHFGDPIFPSLVPIDRVDNGSESDPWHILIEAENYHALQLLEYLYAGSVDCIYIDPPYNTGASEWKYNNDYVDPSDRWRHSKWVAMMHRRLAIARRLLSPNGALICAIDDNELPHLMMLLKSMFPNKKLFPVTIQHNPGGTQGSQFSVTHEYALFVIPESLPIYPKPHFGGQTYNLRRWGSTSGRYEGQTCFYPIYVKDGKIVDIGPLADDDYMPPAQTIDKGDGVFEVWPIDIEGNHKKWRYSRDTIAGVLDRTIVTRSGDRIEILLQRESERPKTVWTDKKYNSEQYGTVLLKEIVKGATFEYPKSLYNVLDCLRAVLDGKKDALVLDFFAGSGTTLHAVNLLNAIDNGTRHCILVTNNEVSKAEMKKLSKQGNLPGDPEWERHGICQSVTWPRTKFTVLGKRDDGSELDGAYYSGKVTVKEKRRTFRMIGFTSPEELATKSKKEQLVDLIPDIPKSRVKKDSAFIVEPDKSATVLFDCARKDEWLEALEGMEHITSFYIVTSKKSVFDDIKKEVQDLLGPYTVMEEEKRPRNLGFSANVEYFRLDFLDPNEVALGKEFKEILPLLWLKAGAKGPRPVLSDSDPLPPMLIPSKNPFAVLIDEAKFADFVEALHHRGDVTHVFLVTDSQEAYQEMASQLNVSNVFQLYRDYLENFMINRGDGA